MEPFKNELICPSVLKKVLERDVVRHIKLKDDKSDFIYERVSAAAQYTAAQLAGIGSVHRCPAGGDSAGYVR